MERSVLEELPEAGSRWNGTSSHASPPRESSSAVVGEGAWIDIGTAQRYIEAHGTRGRRPDQAPRPQITEDGDLLTTDSGSWAWVGPGATVDPTARLDRAVVLDGATIGAGSRGVRLPSLGGVHR